MVNVAQTHSLGCMPLLSSIYFIFGHIISTIKPNYLTNSSLALTRFWPWVCVALSRSYSTMVIPWCFLTFTHLIHVAIINQHRWWAMSFM
jgi:hypothetical protein